MNSSAKQCEFQVVSKLSPRLHFCNSAILFSLKHALGGIGFWKQSFSDSALAVSEYDNVLCNAKIDGGEFASSFCVGYGKGISVKNSDALNEPFENLSVSLENALPVLNLLENGLYVAADFEQFPFCKQGAENEFFWDSTQVREPADFSCFRSLAHCNPLFLFPTKRAELFDKKRFDYYVDLYKSLENQKEKFPRCFAFYLNGACSMLLDGHHKATAAAYIGEKIKTIVIFKIREREKDLDFAKLKSRLYFSQSVPQNENELFANPAAPVIYDGEGDYVCSVFSAVDAVEKSPIKDFDSENKKAWGNIPKEILKLEFFPSYEDLCVGTMIPPNKIKTALYSFIPNVEGIDDFELTAEQKTLRAYCRIFPESKWLSESDRSRLLTKAEKAFDGR